MCVRLPLPKKITAIPKWRRKKEGRRNVYHDDPESMDPEHSSIQRERVGLQAMLSQYTRFSSFVGDACFYGKTPWQPAEPEDVNAQSTMRRRWIE